MLRPYSPTLRDRSPSARLHCVHLSGRSSAGCLVLAASGVHFRFRSVHALAGLTERSAGQHTNQHTHIHTQIFALEITCSLLQSGEEDCVPAPVRCGRSSSSEPVCILGQLCCSDSGSTLNWTVCGFDYKFEFQFASAHQLFTVLQSINRSSFGGSFLERVQVC